MQTDHTEHTDPNADVLDPERRAVIQDGVRMAREHMKRDAAFRADAQRAPEDES